MQGRRGNLHASYPMALHFQREAAVGRLKRAVALTDGIVPVISESATDTCTLGQLLKHRREINMPRCLGVRTQEKMTQSGDPKRIL